MKKLMLLITALIMVLSTQAQTERDKMGRTYYDEEEKVVKEVFAFREVQRFDPNNPSGDVEVAIVKHGAYFKYYESGQLKKSGTYFNDEKNNEWVYYDEEGNKTKTIKYRNGELVSETVEE